VGQLCLIGERGRHGRCLLLEKKKTRGGKGNRGELIKRILEKERSLLVDKEGE